MQKDLISRQEAIDALAKFVPYAICDESTESYTNGLTDAYYLILQLPSVQPDHIADIDKKEGGEYMIEVKSDKLKPCPFCGGTGKGAPEMVHDKNGYYARCGNEECALMPMTWYYKTEDEAAEVWNRRANNEAGKDVI